MDYFFKAVIVLFAITTFSCKSGTQQSQMVYLKKSELSDKIKGGWAGQVIGCTYGGPTEFKWNGTMIDDKIHIPWDSTRMQFYYENAPSLYDDVYMDLTFVDVMEKHGIDAPDSLHALAFANAEYRLWHANQAARYNILNGIMPPASGHWKNNPHADDLDFQIEADFAGLMSPGMINTATEIADKIGHIMCYGDGLYGGIYVAAMYSLAFVHNNIEFIVEEALKTIPKESEFHQCIADIIRWHKKYPNDWKSTWFEAQKKWTHEKGCPSGVLNSFNIDAKINAAYIVIGLLYGNGDYGATIDISTRCGYDSDCNPANAAGILGTMTGYSRIPAYWKQDLDKVEDLDFKYTEMSLNKAYATSYKHAVEMITKNGGFSDGDSFAIKYQKPKTAALEVGFEGLHPIKRESCEAQLSDKNKEIEVDMEGAGFVLTGYVIKPLNGKEDVLEADLHIDGKFMETIKMPTDFRTRKLAVAWNYDLKEGKHKIKLINRYIPEGYQIDIKEIITYSTRTPKNHVYF